MVVVTAVMMEAAVTVEAAKTETMEAVVMVT